ncbi:MAG TPA: hypothetical protein VED01_14455 [Burkholderiales bacterium]|nr:hypothetical protein [Burkholderiales bacterium]
MVLVDDKFERAARAQAKALGVPELEIYVYAHYVAGETADVESFKANTMAMALPRMLAREH